MGEGKKNGGGTDEGGRWERGSHKLWFAGEEGKGRK
jgi:hypothetical protein